jgi:hypothetical protein
MPSFTYISWTFTQLCFAGVISLYNSCSHKLLYCGDGLCQKMDVGNAGCAFTRDALTDILANVVKNRYLKGCFASDGQSVSAHEKPYLL